MHVFRGARGRGGVSAEISVEGSSGRLRWGEKGGVLQGLEAAEGKRSLGGEPCGAEGSRGEPRRWPEGEAEAEAERRLQTFPGSGGVAMQMTGWGRDSGGWLGGGGVYVSVCG